MPTVSISVTEFSRGLSEFLNHVQYQGQVLDIERGKRIVARVSPVALTDGFPIDQLDDFLAKGPQLGTDRISMAKDVKAVRTKLRNRASPWSE